MQKHQDAILYSASDVVNYLECEHLTTLDLINLDTPLPKTPSSDEARLIQQKGYAHESAYFAQLQSQYAGVIDIAAVAATNAEKAAATCDAMAKGYDIIFQATLLGGPFVGHADFLRKVARPSNLGNWSYEVLDTKLARGTKGKFVIQLGFYSMLLASAQGTEPVSMHVVLGNNQEKTFRYADYSRYLHRVLARFMARVGSDPQPTYPVPCEKCGQCRWDDLCETRRIDDDHLSQVANISRLQVAKFELAGIKTLAGLAALPETAGVAKMHPETLSRLRQQARLQYKARETGERHYELLIADGNGLRGFGRMPKPDAGDLFFDMEGDPLEEGGLEYLFGLYFHHQGVAQFKAFWAHSRAEEKIAFEAFMDFVTARLHQHPNAHIYHYAHYEQTALKRLMSLHGVREAEVDNLLRKQKLVDLYKVVREGIRVSEPAYSIKNIERFYLDARSSDVKSAGASIVYYERWKETGDQQLLKDIETYNFDDVRSTFELREWLRGIRPASTAWATHPLDEDSGDGAQEDGLTIAERRLTPYRQKLVDPLPADRDAWAPEQHLRELTFQLLDFHRRAMKPQWWAVFARMDMTEEELLEDLECLAGLTRDTEIPSESVKRSIRYTYRYPEQETKLKSDDGAVIIQVGRAASNLKIDEEERRVSFTFGSGKGDVPDRVSLGPGKPINSDILREAVFRFADSIINNEHKYTAIEDFLLLSEPRIKGRTPDTPIIPEGTTNLAAIIDVIQCMDGSYVFIQGPPGAGKTYTGSHVIVALLQRGFKIGISSNSHKAINNLLKGVEKAASEQSYVFKGAKKSDKAKEDTWIYGDMISDVFRNEELFIGLGIGDIQLVAGTAWLFSNPEMDQAVDYLFVDEAGQVALANLVAVGTSTRNIVLLGDQMQLGQPVQGVHPGHSGESSLDYLLVGRATIPPERGIFLAHSWRMHPDVCRFISDAVYDGRLQPEPGNARQSLLLNDNAHVLLAPTGIRYVPIEHDYCSQRSQEEADMGLELTTSLLEQCYRDKEGREHPMTLDDILVVAPYNLQVNLLKKTLPAGARVGTVDKFQGQEAQVVIVSMATSSGDYLPRFIEFLYNKNRLNVAISRAKCLALFIASPALMAIRCTTAEEMALVNTLCWVEDAGKAE